MEVIRTKFWAVQTKGSIFSERSMFVRKKMDVESDIEAVGNLYDTEWAKCAEQAQQRAVSSVNCYFVNFAEFNVSLGLHTRQRRECSCRCCSSQ
jgi:hypothetical protein